MLESITLLLAFVAQQLKVMSCCDNSSVFTKEDISSLPLADAKFQEAKSDYLGPLVVTPEKVAKKIMAMKDNKSP